MSPSVTAKEGWREERKDKGIKVKSSEHELVLINYFELVQRGVQDFTNLLNHFHKLIRVPWLWLIFANQS